MIVVAEDAYAGTLTVRQVSEVSLFGRFRVSAQAHHQIELDGHPST